MSGSLEGAGGIGGLLARTAHSGANVATLSHAFYHADGNGNITYLIKPDQVIGASYTCDPFGRTIASSGTLASANVQRFTSKMWVGNNVDLYYYGYRFYDPVTQRWLNRDLLEEGDGVNLYAFLSNDSINLIDPYGLASDSVSECATRDPELGGFARQIGVADMNYDWLSDDQVDKLAKEIRADIASGKVVVAPDNLLDCKSVEQLLAFVGRTVGIHWEIATAKGAGGDYVWRWTGDSYDDQTVELVLAAWPGITEKHRLRTIVFESTNVSPIGFDRLTGGLPTVMVQTVD